MVRHRRLRRLADLEWFEVLYRVYLSAIVAGTAVLAGAGAIGDVPFTPSQLGDIVGRGPAVLGLVAAGAIVLAVRNGLNGGPVAIEDADVWHVLTAPVDRATVLRRPAAQRLRAAMFAGAVAGGVMGLLLARRFPESAAQWSASGAVFGGALGATGIGAALVTHALGPRRPVASAFLAAVVTWQIIAVLPDVAVPGPLDPFGHLALLPAHHTGSAVIAAIGALLGSILIVLSGLALAGRLSVEALARRGRLVAQLRFAATVQDVRTVLLLRRQLGHEHCRVKPWFRVRSGFRHPTVARSVRGLAHYPARRIGRVALLVGLAAAAHVGVARGTSALVLVAGIALFVAGLDLCESLSQEVDQANLADSYPHERSELFVRHLVAPAMVTVPLLALAVTVAVALRPGVDTLALSSMIGPTALLGGFAGSVINIVRGAPDQIREANETLFMPPEVSGLTTLIRMAWPPAVSIAAQLPVVIATDAARDGRDPWSSAGRAVLAVALAIVVIGGWVRQRDDIRRWWAGLRATGATSKGHRT
jgi:hypothetical protein